ncbi:recombinase family protein [Clostridium sp. SM-530-WT-3G]|uniref:recombinase family protein n=1 Tax=Clostridium sp. SM-530-WT-3G TaxID=2725303 RepID=UPI00145C419C|nr:recombinase family protein [Clostridium sp. SM-530-WT-3G]NME84148.1 recombinase family protein [Clostridium sp. SM-530-WT-3G]
MTKKVFAYARKNIKNELIDEQIKLIKTYCEDNDIELDERGLIIDDSENTFLREGYNALCSYMMRDGDVLIISELDRLGRDIGAIKDEWIKLSNNGIELIILNNPLLSTYDKSDTEKDVTKRVVSELLIYISEKEKAKNKRKQAEGIQALREKNHGRGVGRPKIKVNKDFKVQYKLWKGGRQTAVQTFNNLGLTKATFYRLVKEYEQENNN